MVKKRGTIKQLLSKYGNKNTNDIIAFQMEQQKEEAVNEKQQKKYMRDLEFKRRWKHA